MVCIVFGIRRKSLLLIIGAILFLKIMVLSGCEGTVGGGCNTSVSFCASTAETIFPSGGAAAEGGCPTEVRVCPGESAYLYWKASNDVKSVKIVSQRGEDLGTYPLQEGSIKVFPGNTTTEYTLTANGQCEITKKITIRVVHEGEIAVIVANGNQDVGFEANIQPNSTSSKIIVSSIKSVQCAGNASFWPNWNCTKTDTTGVNYLSPSDKETPVKCLLFVGKWQFKPTQMAYSEKTACFQVTYGCAPCVTPTPQPTMFPVPTPAPSV